MALQVLAHTNFQIGWLQQSRDVVEVPTTPSDELREHEWLELDHWEPFAAGCVEKRALERFGCGLPSGVR